jgi:hypothetical protein
MSAIPSTLAQLAVPIESLHAYPRNPRRGRVDEIKRSLVRHGQYRPLVVNRPSGEVLAGNHTLLAACELGWREIAATFVDVDDDTAARIVLIDNRTNDLASYDDAELAELLESLPDLDGTGYDDDDLAALLASLDDEQLDLDDEGEEPRSRYTFDVFTREQIIDAAFDDIRASGFPYRTTPLHVQMTEINDLRATSLDALLRSNVGYRVADHYHPHRWHAKVDGRRNALDIFESDAYLRVAIEHVLDYGLSFSPQSLAGTLSLTRGAQAVSNFRPGFALSLLRRYAPSGAVVLDASTGYGGRLVGFFASECSEYVGIDPATLTHVGNEALVDALCPADKRVELHCAAAEDVSHDVVRERCDVAITSPPYFSKEHYVDEPTQSFKRYSDGESWRDGFLRPLLALQHVALRPGGVNLLNIADVTIRGVEYPLVEWALDAGRDVGFEVVTIERYTLQQHFGKGVDRRISENGVATEPLIVMRKQN